MKRRILGLLTFAVLAGSVVTTPAIASPDTEGAEPAGIVAVEAKVSRGTMIARLQAWVKANVSYSKTAKYQGYRKDCSGYVSMAWGLSKPGATTASLAKYAHRINNSQLAAGDIMLDDNNHVTVFHKWANTAHTRYYMYEETPSYGAHYDDIPFPYYSSHPGHYLAYRFNNVA